MSYADLSDYAEYTGEDQADLPDDYSRLLERASELIDYHVIVEIDTTEPKIEEAVRKATCAQLQFWIRRDDEIGSEQDYESISIGGFSATKAGDNSSTAEGQQLAPRTIQHLGQVGLTYTGVKTK